MLLRDGVVQEVLVPGRESMTFTSRAREIAVTIYIHGRKGRMQLRVARLIDGNRGRRAPERPRRVMPHRYWWWWEVESIVIARTSGFGPKKRPSQGGLQEKGGTHCESK